MNVDFFEADFSELFLNKHGKEIYNKIKNKIMKENKQNCDEEYISIVFKIAFLSFFGLEENGIQNLINDYYSMKNIDTRAIIKQHKTSISEIKKYLKFTNDTEK